MDLGVNEFVDGLLSEEAHMTPSDNVKLSGLEQEMRFPEWFDRELYNRGRRFYLDYAFGFTLSMIMGVVPALSVPSILKIGLNTQRSNSTYTAYRRFTSTLKHADAWFRNELEPGSIVWRSLLEVRKRHLRAGKASKLAGLGTVSQRDLALNLSGFSGLALLHPEFFGIRQNKPGDWEGYNMFWRTIGYMVGLEDRYNVCRKNIEETRQVCRILHERVFLPCLENSPEYFEHGSRSYLGGLNMLTSFFDPGALIFATKYLMNVPGYFYTEGERIALQKKITDHLKGKSEDTGVDTANFVGKSVVGDLPKLPPRLLYLRDYDCIETAPAYRKLNFKSRYIRALLRLLLAMYNTEIGRVFLNFFMTCNRFFAFYFPYKAFVKFGVRKSIVFMFSEGPKDGSVPKPNSEYSKLPPTEKWYEKLIAVLW